MIAKLQTVTLVLSYAVLAMSSCPNIISRRDWGAKNWLEHQSLSQKPPPFVVIHHSDTPSCTSTAACKSRVANIQNYHMNHNGWKDIGYNFLIGGDGNVYEGRGWGAHGAHCPSYNSKSIGVCLIGDFMNTKPPTAQLNALRDLLECGVSKGEIDKNYSLIGHRQGRATTCPGNALFNEIKTWPHFNSNISNN